MFSSYPSISHKKTYAFALLASTLTAVGCTQNPTIAQETPTPAIDASPVSVKVSADVVGQTPTRIGYVLGDVKPGSNVSSWLRYNEINTARFWWNGQLWPERPAAWTGENTLARFESEREKFRGSIEKAIDWKKYRAEVAKAYGGTPKGTIGESFVLSELTKMGATPLLMLSHSVKDYPFDKADGTPDWNSRWAFWRGAYTNAFYLARTYGVERFQIFNEPDHSAHADLQQNDFIRRLQIGSDAVQAAVLDVNRMDGKNLKAQVSAPVTAGMTVYSPRTGRKDTRDQKVGWGELSVKTRKDDFPGKGSYNQGSFGVYAFQNYTRTGDRVSGRLPEIIEQMTKDNGGERLPIIVSEMNVSTAADFSKTDSTLDTPKFYAGFGSIAAAYTNSGLNEAYVFRHTQTANFDSTGAIKKNGTHYLNNSDPLKNVLGSTKGAEAARLWSRGFNGGRTRFAVPATSSSDVYTVAARDENKGVYTLMVSNLGGNRAVNIDLASWKLPNGTYVSTEEVSETHHGDISSISALPANSQMSLNMSENSIVLLTLRPNVSTTPRVLPVAYSEGLWRADAIKSLQPNSQVLLSLGAFSAKPTRRIRVYGGRGELANAELLGQVVPAQTAGQFTVDVTRYVSLAKEGPLFFQIVDDSEKTNSFNVTSAQLQVMEAKN